MGMDSSSSKTHTGRHKQEAVHLMMVAVNYTKSWLEGGLGGVVVEVNLRSKCSQPVAFPHSPSPTRYTNPKHTGRSMKPNQR